MLDWLLAVGVFAYAAEKIVEIIQFVPKRFVPDISKSLDLARTSSAKILSNAQELS